MKSERRDRFRIHTYFLITLLVVLGILVMFGVYNIVTRAERRSMEVNAGETLDFLQSVCQSIRRLPVMPICCHMPGIRI